MRIIHFKNFYISLIMEAVNISEAVPLHAMEALGGERRYSSYSFSTSALDRVEWSTSRPGRVLPPWERTPGTHCTGRWVGPSLDTESTSEKSVNIYQSTRRSIPDDNHLRFATN
jgi:hypothetical protein